MTESKVTDAARNAARDAIWAVLCPSVRSTPEDAKIYGHAAEMALEAALPLLSQPVSGERATALEEAAQACERRQEAFLSPEYAFPQPLGSFAERFACEECAKAIRALSQSPPSGERGDKL